MRWIRNQGLGRGPNLAIATQEVIEELIKLAKEMSVASQQGVDLGLNDNEVAFYDALAANKNLIIYAPSNSKVDSASRRRFQWVP